MDFELKMEMMEALLVQMPLMKYLSFSSFIHECITKKRHKHEKKKLAPQAKDWVKQLHPSQSPMLTL